MKKGQLRGLEELETVSIVNWKGGLKQFEHAEHKHDTDLIKRCTKMETNRVRQMGCSMKTW